jgi:hypothetical protein
MWARSPAAKSSSLISTGTRCSCNLSAANTRGLLRRAIANANHEQRSEDVCSGPHNGLKSDIAPCPKVLPKDRVIGRPRLWIAEDFGCCASG